MVCVCLSSLDERTRFHAIHEYLDAALKKVYGIKTMYVINSKGLNIKNILVTDKWQKAFKVLFKCVVYIYIRVKVSL